MPYAVDAVSGHQRSVRRRRCALCRKPAPGQRWCGTPDHTEGYWVADAKLGYRVNSNLDLQLNMYNLFDTDYVASINKRLSLSSGRTPDLYADGERPFLSLRGAVARFRNTAMMYHIPDVLSTDRVAEFTRQLAQAEWVDGRVTVVERGRPSNRTSRSIRTPLYARLQAAVLDMLRGHPQFFPPRCRGRFPRRCLTAMGGETYGFTSMAPFARTARRARDHR